MTSQKNAGGDENSDSTEKYNPSYPVTWDELIHIRANGLSLDKYDEIRLRKTVPDCDHCAYARGRS